MQSKNVSQTQHIPMESTMKLIRKSIFLFLKNYQYFTKVPILLILPFSASILLSQFLFSSSPLAYSTIYHFHQVLDTHVIKTILIYVVALFSAHTTLLLAKALVIQTIFDPKSSPSITFSSFKSLFVTQLCNSCLIISLYRMSINLLQIICPLTPLPRHPLLWALLFGICYSFFANANAIGNLALVVSKVESSFGFSAIFKAFSMSWNTSCGILSTNLPTNLGIFAVETLFGHRIIRIYREKGFFGPYMAIEGILIVHLYSVLIILDTVASCVFYKSCKENDQMDCKDRNRYRIIVVDEQDGKIFEHLEISVQVE